MLTYDNLANLGSAEAVARRCFVKKVFLKISQNSQENTCARVSFLIKSQAEACNFIKKETMAQVFSYEFCEISKNTFSHRKLPDDCFSISQGNPSSKLFLLTNLWVDSIQFRAHHKKSKKINKSHSTITKKFNLVFLGGRYHEFFAILIRRCCTPRIE